MGALTETGKAVFLSYASQDAEAAQHLCNVLRAAGIEVWFDQSELRGGDAWDQMIRRQVKGCYLFVPIISANSQSRKEGYFRREWKLAVDRTNDMAEGIAFLLPVVIDDTSDLEALVPEKFREVQWTRLPQGANTDAFAEHVRRLIALETTASTSAHPRSHPTPAPSTSLPPSAAPARSAPPTNRSVLPWVVIGLLILGIGYFVAGKYLVSKHSTTTAEAPVTALVKPNVVSDKSIAVLPFADMSEKHDQEYFGDGMAEEILDLLAKIPGLTVIGRTSSFQFKGKNEDLRTIGAKLNVAYVLEGSVRNSGDQVRITAQLINTRTGAHEWSETYDRQFGDVLKLQDAIAAAVARELQFTAAVGQMNSRSTLTNADAYDLVLRGRHAADRWDPEDLAEAVSLFQQALERDPRSADAAAWLAYTYEKIGAYGGPTDSLQHSRDAARTALTLDPKKSLAHVVLGKIYMLGDWDWTAAERELKKAATLAPGSADPLIGQARLSTVLGRCDDALRQIKAALALDPLDPNGFEALWLIQVCRGHLPEAEASIRRALDIRPTYILGHVYLGLTLIARRDYDAALLEMQQEPIDAAKQFGLTCAYYAFGRKTESDTALAGWLKRVNGAYYNAGVYACRNQSDEAFRWLERAYADKSAQLPYLKTDLALSSLAADARFKALLRKMNLPE